MANKKQINIKDYCEKLIGKKVKHEDICPFDPDFYKVFYGRIIRVRLEILEEETGKKTLRGHRTVELDTSEVKLF